MLGFDKTCCGVRMAARKKCGHLRVMEIAKKFGLEFLPPPGT
jgi:hypothetical protein